jgi:CubicO group peptidase (beta-lactamase class C family)
MGYSCLKTICVLLLDVVFISAAHAQAGKNAIRCPDHEILRALENNVPEIMELAGVTGISMAVICEGKTYWLHSFGVKDATTNQAVTDDTLFEAKSLSKVPFAYAVLKLVDQGKIDLDAPLTKYLPKPYIEADERLSKITARYVLSHRTGFPNWRDDGKALTIRFTPGERFSYSGEGIDYLQTVVEGITGKPLNEFMTATVFTPLGMASSSYSWREGFENLVATGHDEDGQASKRPIPKEANAAWSLRTTARDYALFVDTVLNGVGLKPATLKEMETPQVAVDPTCLLDCFDGAPKELSKSIYWGLGWGIEQTDQGKSIWHWGDSGGWRCYVTAVPQRKVGIVIFTNSANGLSIANEIVKRAIGADQPAIAWLRYESYDSPTKRFAAAVGKDGADGAIEAFRPELGNGTISEHAVNELGYRLLHRKRIAEAIQVFLLNVELHPTLPNVYDSLGEAYLDEGNKDLAIRNYKKAVELNPNYNHAAEMLKKINEQ